MSQSDTENLSPVRERARTGQPVANPRRLRLGRDGRPMPPVVRDEDPRRP